jgi:SAM-dependent methyltransferase
VTRAFLRCLSIVFTGSLLLPVVTNVGARLQSGNQIPVAHTGLALLTVLTAVLLFQKFLARISQPLEADAQAQVAQIEAIPARWIDVSIAGAAALSLFLELAMIRWQASVFPFFAFYTNFGLLACFAGLGLGYALAGRDRIPLLLVVPALAWQVIVLLALKSMLGFWQLEFLGAMPVVEQLSMGLRTVKSLLQGVTIYFFLSVVFLLTAVAFIPIGQLCGRLMTRRPHLHAYGLNLFGSLAGVVAAFLASAFWTPPIVWFAAGLLGVLLFAVRRPPTLITGSAVALVTLAALAWPTNAPVHRVYSPYQMLEFSYGDRGLMNITAAGHYYQRVHDFSRSPESDDPRAAPVRAYYDLAYQLPGERADVAIVGAGAGNDVAAALRGGAKRVFAIEIDPAIQQAGMRNHPERPYRNPRVHAVLNDARSFLRNTDERFDLIVYGLLDSHSLLSHASIIRLDSYVYTVEAFREARSRLKPGGRLVLSFASLNPSHNRKSFEMLKEAFDGVEPVAVAADYDGAVVFIQREGGPALVPAEVLAASGFKLYERAADPSLQVDVSTDDWPFFYMPRRVYPVSYLVLIGLVLLAGVALTANFINERPRSGELSFLLLGAGFMLVETKAITELGLTFGSTWRVTAIVICGVLLMAFLANAAVARFRIQRPQVAFVMLLASLGAGWWMAGAGGFGSTTGGRIATVALLTCPMFFSGIVFSTLLRGRHAIAAVMAANLSGAMLGGLLEYNSMYFGFRFMYLLALGFYGLAFVHWALTRGRVEAVGRQRDRERVVTPLGVATP